MWVKKKGNQESILNISKLKCKILKLLSVDDRIFIFLSYGTSIVHIGSVMAAQQSFLYSMSKLSSSKFWVCAADSAVRMHYLLLCCESSHKCHHAAQTTSTWTKTILTGFMTLIAVQHPIAEYDEQCTKWKKNKNAIMHCYIFFFFFEKFWVKPGFLKKNTHTVYAFLIWLWYTIHILTAFRGMVYIVICKLNVISKLYYARALHSSELD